MLRFFRKKSNPKKELKKVLGEFKLPTFPAVAMKGLRMLRDDRVSLSAVAEVLVSDPGISVRLLSTVNSAAHALRRQVRDVPQAATLLGRSNLESILLSVAVGQTLPRASAPGFDSKRFWQNAARRAATARSLARLMHPGSSSASYTAALLQDMAVPILAHAVQQGYGAVLDNWREQGTDLAGLERDAFGWDHTEVAGWMCSAWSFPEELTGAIVTHHHASDEERDEEHTAPPAVRLVAHLRDTSEVSGIDELVDVAEGEFRANRDDVRRHVDAGLEEASAIASVLAG